VELVPGLDGERLDLLDLAEHERVVVRVAEQPHGEDRVRHRGIDAAEPARHREALLEPEARGLDRTPAQRARGEPLPDLEPVVHGDEEVLPEELAPAERLGHAREAQARLLARLGPELVEAERGRQPLHGLPVHDDQQRHGDGA
jgi:hypothetical protein